MFKKLQSKLNRALLLCGAVGTVAGVGVLVFPASVSADNQFIAGADIGTSDPAPSVFNGRVYFYCTEDAVGGGDLTIYNIGVYSTSDMYHWSARRVALNENNIAWSARAGMLWAPHCVYIGGQYHLYFPETASGGTFHIGHATCSTPDGTFTADNSWMAGCGNNAIDPYCFIEDDNTAHIIWDIVGVTPNTVYIRPLNASYNDATGTQSNITSGMGTAGDYKEGMWMIKSGGTYYHYYAHWPSSAERIALSTSTTRTSGYSFRADLMMENTNSATIHPGICQFPAGGQWYMFWHCGGNEFGGSITNNAKRVSGIEFMTLGGTSQIPKTRRGVGVPSYNDTIQADRGVFTGGPSALAVTSGEPRGWVIQGIANNSSVQYANVNFGSGTPGPNRGIMARVSSTGTGGFIDVHVGSTGGTLIGTITVPNTGSLTTWQTVTQTTGILTTTGTQNLYLVFRTSATNLFRVNWISLLHSVGTIDSRPASAAPVKFSCERINTNTFKVDLPAGAVASDIRLFNLKGQEAVKLVTSNSQNIVTVSFDAKVLASGSYVLKVKSSKGSFEHPFIY